VRLYASSADRVRRVGRASPHVTLLLVLVALAATACGPRFDRNELTVEASGGQAGQVQTGEGTAGTGGAPIGDGSVGDASGGVGSVDGADGSVGDVGADGSLPGDQGDAGAGDGSGDGTGDAGTDGGDTSGTTSGSGSDGSGGSTTGTGTGSGGTPGGSGGTTPQDPGNRQGVTDTTIKLGYLLPLTGAAPVPSKFDDGVRLYWDVVNAAGGINGRQVSIIIYDTESSTTKAVDQARRAVTQDKVFTILSLDRLEVQDAIAKFVEQVGMPHVMVQSPANPPSSWTNTFIASVDHGVQGRAIADFFGNDLAAANGAKKVAFVREQTNALKPGTDAFEAQAAALGMEVVARLTINPQDTDQGSTVLALQQSGAEIVWLYMAPTVAANIVSRSGAQGYVPTWFANTISWNFELMHGVTANFLNGSYAFSSWISLDHPRAAEYKREYQARIGPNPDDIGLVGWGGGEILGEALRAAGPALGWNTFRTAVSNLKTEGGVWTPLDFTRGSIGSRHVAVYKSNGSKWTTIDPARQIQ